MSAADGRQAYKSAADGRQAYKSAADGGQARMSAAESRRLAFQVVWTLRYLGLFLIGPVIGVCAGAAIFGLPRNLQVAAAIMFVFSLSMFTLLVRGEWRRLLDRQ